MRRGTSSFSAFPLFAVLALACALASGCAVVGVASTAVGVAATGVGLAVDATVGTVKAVGSAASAIVPGGDSK
jgi:hypothetical protein